LKIFSLLGFFFPIFPVIGLIFVTCEVKMLGVLCLSLGLFFTGCGFGAGFLVNYNDISGSFSSITFGIGNTFGSIPGIIAPYVVGVLTKNVINQFIYNFE
jgi:ACS family sodium-dependent inorganic phosphate cotransporter-like MFS transporter 5